MIFSDDTSNKLNSIEVSDAKYLEIFANIFPNHTLTLAGCGLEFKTISNGKGFNRLN